MRTTLIALLLSTTSALGADMGVLATERPPTIKAAPPELPRVTWSGFYFGINGGYGWGSATQDNGTITVPGLIIVSTFSDPAPKGFVLGGHAGFNYQFNGVGVGGIEVDYNYGNITDTQSTPLFVGANLQTKVDELASVRGRLGLLATPELLFYGTAGPAWGHGNATGTIFGATEKVFVSTNGWVAGGGAEWMVDPRWLLRLEGLHYQFGDTTFPFTPIGGTFIPGAASLSVNAVRGGLSYKF